MAITGRGAVKRASLNSGHQRLIQRDANPLSAVCQDGHDLDVIGCVEVPMPTGTTVVPIQRLVIQCIVGKDIPACFGYHTSITKWPKATEAIAAVQHALRPWKPLRFPKPFIDYPSGAGFPSGCIKAMEGAAWATHYLDNASIYTSKIVLERMRDYVGCAINLGPVGDWTRRYVIEGIHSVLEKRGFHRMPNTTGSHAKDPKGRDAMSKAIGVVCTWQELLFLIDVAIASYNIHELKCLGGQTALQALHERVGKPNSTFIVRTLPKQEVGSSSIDIVKEKRVIRGNVGQGRSLHVTIDEVPYTSGTLCSCGSLLGRTLWLHVNERDMRCMDAYLDGTEYLGKISAGAGWSRVPHDRAMRREINRQIRLGKIKRRADEEWPQAYLRVLTERAATQAAKAGKRPKVSQAATKAAAVSRQTGLELPEVDVQQPATASVNESAQVPADAEDRRARLRLVDPPAASPKPTSTGNLARQIRMPRRRCYY
jgi:putative transposase